MKNTHICPKCNSNNIVKVPDTESINTISIAVSLLHSAKVSRYVCCDCGFAEEWIENKTDLEKIKTKYR